MILKFKPRNKKQVEALRLWADHETEEILYGGAKNSGKSYFGGSCIFHDALVYPETMYFIARSTLSDIVKYTIPTIQELFTNWGIDVSRYAPFNGQHNYFKCYNGSRVYLIDCDYKPSDPMYERFGSMQMTRGWIEEGGEVVEDAKNNLRLSIGRWKNDKYGLLGKLLITCNPKKNWMKYNYIDPFNKGTLAKEKAVILANVYDNEFRQKGSEKVLEALTGVSRQRLLLGDWEYDSDDDCLISSEKILDLYSNDYVEKGDKYITCDIARKGKDKSVIFVWDGWRLIDVEILSKKLTTEVAERVQKIRAKYNIPLSNVICDEDGVGGGVVDILKCKGFVNNSQPLPNPKKFEKDNFDNLKSQCYWLVSDRINTGGVYIEYDLSSVYQDGESIQKLLNQELENVRDKGVDEEKKKGVMPKDEVKKLIGRSPDFADTLMMREWFELKPILKILAG